MDADFPFSCRRMIDIQYTRLYRKMSYSVTQRGVIDGGGVPLSVEPSVGAIPRWTASRRGREATGSASGAMRTLSPKCHRAENQGRDCPGLAAQGPADHGARESFPDRLDYRAPEGSRR